MKTLWDYSDLAEAYLKRPDYADDAIDKMLATAALPLGAPICDVGAGVAHLTLQLLRRGYAVTAVEPNDEMRARGSARTAEFPSCTWHEGTGEATGMPDGRFAMVTFGSSFNVTDRAATLREVKRIAQPRGWFACMWNHRDLDDPIQRDVEAIITRAIPDYSYGSRREDQTGVIVASGLFEAPLALEGRVLHDVPASDWIEAWRSHATLARQAAQKRDEIVDAIETYLHARNLAVVGVPYVTRIWVARLR
jgi:SAM-dependent methyltransferase